MKTKDKWFFIILFSCLTVLYVGTILYFTTWNEDIFLPKYTKYTKDVSYEPLLLCDTFVIMTKNSGVSAFKYPIKPVMGDDELYYMGLKKPKNVVAITVDVHLVV